jgi:hypothetical protein
LSQARACALHGDDPIIIIVIAPCPLLRCHIGYIGYQMWSMEIKAELCDEVVVLIFIGREIIGRIQPVVALANDGHAPERLGYK